LNNHPSYYDADLVINAEIPLEFSSLLKWNPIEKNTKLFLFYKTSTDEQEIVIVCILHPILHNSILNEVQQSKLDFISNISHEFRTPLNGIIGMTQILKDTQMSKQQSFCINNIEKCNYDLLNLVNDILDYSKLLNGSLELEISAFNLKDCIENAIDVNLTHLEKNKNNVTLNIDNVSKFILGDKQRIKQVLINLLSNSNKFTKNGEIHINVKISCSDADFTELEFTISDTGCGIPDYMISKLFKPFIQVNSNATQGTGLGLVICKQLCILMGGDISIMSTAENKGTTIRFTIKIKNIHNESQENVSRDCLKNKYVLIVDDNDLNRISLMNTLHKWNMIPIIATNIDEALIYADKYPFYIGIIDIIMNKQSGLWLAEQLIEYKKIDYPLIALSSIRDLPQDNFNINKYFIHYIVKPVKEDILYEILDNINEDFNFNCCENNTNTNLNLLRIKNHQVIESIDSILIVDDVYLNRKLISIFLTKLGFSKSILHEVDCGNDALELINNNIFDLVFLDIKMPDISGVEIYKYILENDLKETTKFIAMTAYIKEKKDHYIFNEKFDYCLYKPIKFEDVQNIVQNL
jgi:signal transduction histidine kinase/DNA-binding response OmpR family regulator